jgi:hypothetical protein
MEITAKNMQHLDDTVLLLTACISPNGMSYTAVQNPMEREAAYLAALSYYLDNTRFRIVFCNNSGEDISSKIMDNEGRVEFLSYLGNDYDKSLGKGYGEFQIIEYAFEHSKLLLSCKRIVKITGKLKVRNLPEILKHSDWLFGQDADFILVNTPSPKSADNNLGGVVDSRCIVGNRTFFERFLSVGNLINDSAGYYFEHLLYKVCEDYRKHSIVAEFPLPLMIEGNSWTSGAAYRYKTISQVSKMQLLQDYCVEANKTMNGKMIKVRLTFIGYYYRLLRLYYRVINKLGHVFKMEEGQTEN